jgi:hypothetical protein
LDLLTKEFFDKDFPKFNQRVHIPEHIFATPVPIVELELGIDVDKILSIAKTIPVDDYVSVIDINPAPTVDKLHSNRSWENYENRIHGWQDTFLWSDGGDIQHLEDIYYKKPRPSFPIIEISDAGQQIRDILSQAGLNINLCTLSVFGPKGYCKPHRDIGLVDLPLAYFWIPLNFPNGSDLKIYPSGYVDVKLGNVYLLNQENFTHAVKNDNSMDYRYVLFGFLKPVISEEFYNTVYQAISQQYTIIT